MENINERMYYLNFRNLCGENIMIKKKGEEKVGDVIKSYLEIIKKSNLFINTNIGNFYFIYNAKKIRQSDYEEKINKYFISEVNSIFVNNYSKINYEIISPIKENIFSSVYKAKLLNKCFGMEYVAVKKIFKDKIKYELKYSKCKEITDEDFKPEIMKFNKEIQNMKYCYCENSVKILDYYDTEKEFIIIMELCDETLFDILCRKKDGFNALEIKEILFQLNNVFKRMNEFKISHRDIKLNNILVKYLNKEKTEFKILLSDYGVSNQLASLTQQFSTHVGTRLLMAPEILNNEKYNDKCDLWSLGIIIYQLYTKKFPYNSTYEKGILDEIENKGKGVLKIIKDEKLKDLLSKLLERYPNKRISWEKYFNHPFFTNRELNNEDSCIIY